MCRPLLFVFAMGFLALSSYHGPLLADGPNTKDEHEPDQAEPSAGAIDLDATESDFRELIIARAIDFSDPNQDTAISIALGQDFVDSRFDDLIRAEFKRASKPHRWTVQNLNRAESLLPLSQLDDQERAELMFRCLLLCGEDSDDKRLERRLLSQLGKTPDETSLLVKKAMDQGDDSQKLFSLLRIIGKSSESILPHLLEAAASDDPERASAAMIALLTLLANVRAYREENRESDELAKRGLNDLDPKLIKYAERIMTRYDKNGDNRLNAKEYQTMLMSPASADLDGDDEISVNEYAGWLYSRTKRN